MASESIKAPDPKKAKFKDVIVYWAGQGVSQRSISAKCGLSLDKFLDLLNTEDEKGNRPFKTMYEVARADYECTLRLEQNHIRATTESEKLKYTIIKDQLIEMKEPHTKAAAVETQDTYTGYEIVIRPKANDADQQKE
jgi:hypothetical protein